nr:MAG TPA: hypothetical protein [Caudoviricetes sp.]
MISQKLNYKQKLHFLKLKGIVTGYLKDFILNIRLWYT